MVICETMIILSGVSLLDGLPPLPRALRPRFAPFLRPYSYSLYLVHNTMLILIKRLLPQNLAAAALPDRSARRPRGRAHPLCPVRAASRPGRRGVEAGFRPRRRPRPGGATLCRQPAEAVRPINPGSQGRQRRNLDQSGGPTTLCVKRPARRHAMHQVSLTVNGTPHTESIEGRTLLVELLRETLGLTGTHVGCDTSQCGACVVHVDGRSVKACTMLAMQGRGRPGHHHRGAGPPRTARCIPCRRCSASITPCNAASARRAW